MDNNHNIECNKPMMRKPKKKQAKGELDRLKQAEKKKRRLEKALATSAAIISELEKKKQKKKEEQQRLDEEGAAIAEAVALHVLLGEDSDESSKMGFDLFVSEPRKCLPGSEETIGWVSNGSGSGLGEMDNGNWSLCYGSFGSDFSVGFSADIIAAQAVSSLRIAEDAQVDSLIFNGVLG